MSRTHMKLLGAALLMGAAVTAASSARAFEITQVIPGTSETACADVNGANTTAGTPVGAYPCTGAFNEWWADVAGNFQGLGTSSDVKNCANPSNDELVLGACSTTGGPWIFGNPGQIVDAETDLCFDSQGKFGGGVAIALNTCDNAASQTWLVKDIVFTQQMPGKDEHACVHILNEKTANGTPVDASACGLGVGERWTWANGQLHGLGTGNGNTTCLGTKEANGVYHVVLQTCGSNSELSQQWVVIGGEDSKGDLGAYVFNGNGGCLDSQDKFGNVQLIVSTTCAGTASQLWALR